MKALVIGSGLIGITTAYFLRRNGHDVTVVDRADGPGREASFANAGLLSPASAEPWNAPGSWRVLLGSLIRSDASLQLRLRALPDLLGWGIGFLRNSRIALYERNALSNLRLAVNSLEVMETLRQQTCIEYGYAKRGTLKIFRDQTGLNHASRAANRMSAVGVTVRRFSGEEIVKLEPALIPIVHQLVGALHFEINETGDAHQFCVALADHARQLGVEFRFRTEVSSLEMHSESVAVAVTAGELLEADQFIVAAGSYSTLLLRRAGIHLPVRPAKGYSITIDDDRARPSLRIPVIDDHWHAAVVPLEGAIRVAGTAEFAGYDITLAPERIRNLKMLLREVLPQAQFDFASAKPWCGLRAMAADGVPIIGPTRIANLLVNTGHGHLGWTMAAASGKLLADMMSGESPSIDPAPYSLARFGSS